MSIVATDDLVSERLEWCRLVQESCEQVARWAEEDGWQVSWKTLDRVEELLGSYQVPMLTNETAHRTVIVEPVARMVMGATGRIDLYAYPTLFRVMLLRSGQTGDWRIRTDSGIFLKETWGKETFSSLVADLTAAPIPSILR